MYICPPNRCLILIAIVVPYVVALIVPVAFAFVWVGSRYIKAARDLRRLEAVSTSPVYASILSTLSGLATIRSFGVQDTVHDGFLRKLQDNSVWVFASQRYGR